jgi:hypothetical protein
MCVDIEKKLRKTEETCKFYDGELYDFLLRLVKSFNQNCYVKYIASSFRLQTSAVKR